MNYLLMFPLADLKLHSFRLTDIQLTLSLLDKIRKNKFEREVKSF